MIYVFTEDDLDWKFLVTSEDLETAIKLLVKELKPKGYTLIPQENDDWHIDVHQNKKLVGTLGIAEYPFEMNQVY